MLKSIQISRVAAFCLVVCAGASAFAQSDSQKFKVVVPSRITISAPADVTITHDESDNDQDFATQQWVVKGNVSAGVNVSFATDQAFTHTTDNTWKRDAKLTLSVGSTLGPGTWTVNTATDTTDYANSDGVATVAASSNGVGRANFDLDVTFITDTFSTFAAGDYEMTVTGTVASN